MQKIYAYSISNRLELRWKEKPLVLGGYASKKQKSHHNTRRLFNGFVSELTENFWTSRNLVQIFQQLDGH